MTTCQHVSITTCQQASRTTFQLVGSGANKAQTKERMTINSRHVFEINNYMVENLVCFTCKHDHMQTCQHDNMTTCQHVSMTTSQHASMTTWQPVGSGANKAQTKLRMTVNPTQVFEINNYMLERLVCFTCKHDHMQTCQHDNMPICKHDNMSACQHDNMSTGRRRRKQSTNKRMYDSQSNTSIGNQQLHA